MCSVSDRSALGWIASRGGRFPGAHGWLRRSTPDDLLQADLFHDLVPMDGVLGLGRELHSSAVEAAQRSSTFIASLVDIARPLALRIGYRVRSTPERIPDAGAAERLAPSDERSLVLDLRMLDDNLKVLRPSIAR